MARQSAQQRKRNARTRSAQVRANRNINFQDGIKNLRSLNKSQLEHIARQVGTMYDNHVATIQQHAAHEQYYAAPQLHVTNKDKLFAGRKAPSDQEIASAPAKRRKTLRQQQRKILQAQSRIQRAKLYAQENSHNVTVLQQRMAERRGEMSAQGDVQARLYGTPDTVDAFVYSNPLNSSHRIHAMPKKVLMSEVIDRVKDLQNSGELKKSTANKPKNRGKTKDKAQKHRRPMSAQSAYRQSRNSFKPSKPRATHGLYAWQGKDARYLRYLTLVEKQFKGAFGSGFAREFNKMSARKKFKLLTSTGFQHFIAQHATYDAYTRKVERWESPDEQQAGWDRIEERMQDFLDNA